jgi:hypothetical protein
MQKTIMPKLRIRIRPSKLIVGEVGLFVVCDIKKDSIVTLASSYNEIPYPWSAYNDLDEQTKIMVDGFCSATKDVFYGPPDFNYLSINWYMNHSCEPNVGFDDIGNFVAMRDIVNGEELTWDYSFNETNPNFIMQCECGTPSCRRAITGNDWKFLVKDNIKFPYISREIRELS